jgi:hypothetical protein
MRPRFAANSQQRKSMRNVLKRAAFALLLVLGLTLGGVVSAQMGGAKEPAKDEKKAEAKKIDLPWTLDEVKKGMKAGATAKYKIVSNFGGSENTSFYLQELTEVNEKGYKSKNTSMDAEGKAIGEPETEEKTWEAFGDELKFTDADTKVSEGKCKVGAGEFDCKIYTQTKEEEGGKQVMVFYFIKDKPGHIAKVSMEMTGADGKVAGTMSYELVEVK